MVVHEHGPFVGKVFAKARAFSFVIGCEIIAVIADQVSDLIRLLAERQQATLHGGNGSPGTGVGMQGHIDIGPRLQDG